AGDAGGVLGLRGLERLLGALFVVEPAFGTDLADRLRPGRHDVSPGDRLGGLAVAGLDARDDLVVVTQRPLTDAGVGRADAEEATNEIDELAVRRPKPRVPGGLEDRVVEQPVRLRPRLPVLPLAIRLHVALQPVQP